MRKKTQIAGQNIKPPALLMTVIETAALIGCSRSHLLSMLASGKVPLPVRLGRKVMWHRTIIEKWCAAGCPDLETWAAMIAAERRRGLRAI